MEAFLGQFEQPEYIHVLLNPMPVYGLAIACLALFIALVARSRGGRLIALILVLATSGSVWPTYVYGEKGFDRVLSMSDSAGEKWLKEHRRRGENLIFIYYAAAALAAVALVLPAKWPRSGTPFAIAVLVLAVAALATGSWIAFAGGQVRHREFRTGPPPEEASAGQ